MFGGTQAERALRDEENAKKAAKKAESKARKAAKKAGGESKEVNGGVTEAAKHSVESTVVSGAKSVDVGTGKHASDFLRPFAVMWARFKGPFSNNYLGKSLSMCPSTSGNSNADCDLYLEPVDAVTDGVQQVTLPTS